MPIVTADMPLTSARCNDWIGEIVRTYPFCRSEELTRTAFGRAIRTLVVGNGPRKVLYAAAHHANEWITSLVLLKFAEDFARAIGDGTQIGDVSAGKLAETATFYLVPMVDPDGVDLVTGAIPVGSVEYEIGQGLSDNYPTIPFPDGWKANLMGVDLNLQYPALWRTAREIKFARGYTCPGPRDFVGRGPLTQLESRALAGYTDVVDPELVLALHTQGKVIYWQFSDIVIPGARELGEELATLSGYTLADTPPDSAYAGYKDWFIQSFRRPGYTIEAGEGENPLPLRQFDEIYEDVLPILIRAAQETVR